MKNKAQNTQKTRAHIVLFLNNSPFKSRTVELKTRYKRQEKHRNNVYFGWQILPISIYYAYS